jgi:TPR repeat protein
MASEALADAFRGEHRQARRKLARAARAGDADTLFHIGQAYRLGLRDAPAAMGSYQRAADLGSVAAMAQLGSLYADQRDWLQAEHWLRRALTEGDDLEFAVGYARVLLALDRRTEARQWCQRAADAGDGLAAAMLGLLGDESGPAAEPAAPAADDGHRLRLAELPIMGALAVLLDQYRSTRDTVVLEVAVAKGREYLDGLTGPEAPSMEFCVLWRKLLRTWYAESGADGLFPELVKADRMRVAAAVPEDPDYPVYLVDLATTLLASVADWADPDVFDEVADLLRRGLARLPADHPERGPAQALLVGVAIPAGLLSRAAGAGRRGRLATARATLAELTVAVDHALRTLPEADPELTEQLTAQKHAGQAAAKLIDDALLRGPGPAPTGESTLTHAESLVHTAIWHLAIGEPDQAVAVLRPVTGSVDAGSGEAARDGRAAHAHWVHAIAAMSTGDTAAVARHGRAALRYSDGIAAAAGKPAGPQVVAAAWVVADLTVRVPVGLPLADRIALLGRTIDTCGESAPARLVRVALLQQKAALLLDAVTAEPDPVSHPSYQEAGTLLAKVLAVRQELHDASDPDRRAELVTAQLLAARAATVDPGGGDRAAELVTEAWQGIQALTWQREALRAQAVAVAEVVTPNAGDAVRRAQASHRWPT